MYLLFIWRSICVWSTKSNLLLGKQNTSILITALFIVIEYKYLCLKNILENYNTDKRKIFVNCRNFYLSLQKHKLLHVQLETGNILTKIWKNWTTNKIYYYSVFFLYFLYYEKTFAQSLLIFDLSKRLFFFVKSMCLFEYNEIGNFLVQFYKAFLILCHVQSIIW